MPGQVDRVIEELAPGVVLRLHVDPVAVVEEMEREGGDPVRALILEIHRRGLAEGREQLRSQCARRRIDLGMI